MLLESGPAILSPAGYEVAGFRSGEAALRSFEAAPLTSFANHRLRNGLDLMNGLELVKACRKSAQPESAPAERHGGRVDLP